MRRAALADGPVSQKIASNSNAKTTKNASGNQCQIDLLTKWKLLQAIMADPSVDAVAKLPAAKLLHHCNTKTRRCDPSYQTIADGICYSRRHVMRAVSALAKAGW